MRPRMRSSSPAQAADLVLQRQWCFEPIGHGVLDARLKRGMTAEGSRSQDAAWLAREALSSLSRRQEAALADKWWARRKRALGPSHRFGYFDRYAPVAVPFATDIDS